MEKVKLPKEVAEAIEEVWSLNADKTNVVKHLYLTNWTLIDEDHGTTLRNTLGDYAHIHPMEYMSALVHGYVIEGVNT